jgi:hypothetical protein
MQPTTIRTPLTEAQRRDNDSSRMKLRVRFAHATPSQQVAIANQRLPFLRGFVPGRGIQFSALND